MAGARSIGWSARGLIAVTILAILTSSALAQACRAPYQQAVSPQTGPVCVSSCELGSYPQMVAGSPSCVSGVASATCSEPGYFLVMTTNGPVCERGELPTLNPDNTLACRPGDRRIQRPPYLVNEQLTYDVCWSERTCPPGYLTAEDPDAALGSTVVCMLPCQDFVMDQGMAC